MDNLTREHLLMVVKHQRTTSQQLAVMVALLLLLLQIQMHRLRVRLLRMQVNRLLKTSK
jgi:hypothetical protein